MERPLKDDTENYEMLLEEYCDILEETITALKDSFAEQRKRCDYWCTKAMELKALYREQVKETARVRRER